MIVYICLCVYKASNPQYFIIMILCVDGFVCPSDICQPSCGRNGVCNTDTKQCDCFPEYTGASCDEGKLLLIVNDDDINI